MATTGLLTISNLHYTQVYFSYNLQSIMLSFERVHRYPFKIDTGSRVPGGHYHVYDT